MERIDHIASSIGFSDRLDKHFIALSGGEKQLVIVMRAIMHAPEICFLDEPSKSLDPVTARNVREFLKSYAQEHGITMCLTTHNMKEAEEFCDKIAFINHGQLQFLGTPSQFKRRVTVKEIIEVGVATVSEAVGLRLLEIPGGSNLIQESSTRLYCDDAFDIMGDVLAVLNKAGIKAPVRMVEPSLEDAFAFFVKNSRGKP